MFVITNDQLEAFRVPVRKKQRLEILQALLVRGMEAQEGDERSLVITNNNSRATLHFDERFQVDKLVKNAETEYKFRFDREDRLAELLLPGGEETIGFEYDGDLINKILFNGQSTEFSYDTQARITEITSADGRKQQISYNKSAQVASYTSRGRATTTFQYAIRNGATEYSVRDALGQSFRLQEHPVSGEREIQFADGSKEKIFYDAEEEAEVTTLRNGRKKRTYYGAQYPEQILWEDGQFLSIAYNNFQLPASVTNGAGTLEFLYDEGGQFCGERRMGREVRLSFEQERLSTIHYPSGLEVQYRYNSDGKLHSLNLSGMPCTYHYGQNECLSEIHYPNGCQLITDRKVIAGLKEWKLVDERGGLLSRHVYGYDAVFRLTSWKMHDSTLPVKDRNYQIRYDDDGHVLSVHESNTQREEVFTYDIKGNLESSGDITIRYGSMDEPQRIGAATLEYDRNGNITSLPTAEGGLLRLSFSSEGRMMSASTNVKRWVYAYDGVGRRTSKTDGRETWRFFWLGEQLIEEIIEKDGAATKRSYIYDLENPTPVAFVEDGHTYWMHTDVRHAVAKVTDDRGTVVWSADYTAFGQAKVHVAKVRQPWRLAGHYHDEETGLHYSLSRYYSPHCQTFLSLDSNWSLLAASNYSYCDNDPFNRIDADGNMPAWVSPAAAMTAGIVATGLATAGLAALAVAAGVAASPVALGIGAIIVIGAVAGAIGGAVESVVANKMKGEDVCVPCALKAAGMGALLGAVTGGVGKGVGRLLARATPKALAIMSRKTPKVYEWVKNMKFKAHGLELDNIPKDIQEQMLEGYAAHLSNEQKKQFLKGVIKTGSDVPIPVKLTPADKVYKLVPKGSTKPTTSPYYMSESEYLAWKSSGTHPGQKYGLPLSSHAEEFDVFVAVPKKEVTVFESTVAWTSQGIYPTTGGGKQTLLLNTNLFDINPL
ncbi:RHS repeat-associated core domain-containing protein [Flaviaesturariibacter amylovorans]|uniref:Teneurin-like YD-shell domain-containing protein n=1 Tax=Flaviaesturariibacter amylovorans TaxID=1084520 RepID=A0ABP8HR84_9BACT